MGEAIAKDHAEFLEGLCINLGDVNVLRAEFISIMIVIEKAHIKGWDNI